MDFSKTDVGYWRSSVLLKDLKENKSYFFSMKINSIKNKKMRIDAISSIGDPLASIALRGKTLEYYIVNQNKYYEGSVNKKVMSELIQISINPKRLYNIFFDTGIRNKNWTCENDKNGLIKSCENLMNSLKVQWKERSGHRRVVEIKNKKVFVKMTLKEYSPKVETRKSLFRIKKKPGKI